MEKSKPKSNNYSYDYPCVWYYRKSAPLDDLQLKYSVRSACKNLNPSKIIIIGDKPGWFKETDKSIHVLSNPWRGQNWTVGWVPFQHFVTFCQQQWDFDNFLLFNDDFFVTKPIYDWIDYERSEQSYMERTARCKPYHIKTLATFKIVDTRHYFNLHTPMRLKTYYVKILLTYWKASSCKDLDFRTFYGNLFLHDYPKLTAISDPKIFDDVFIEDLPFISTSSNGFRKGKECYRRITEMFPEPCFCEKDEIEKITLTLK